MPLPEDEAVHPLVRKGAAWAWRLLLLSAALVAALWVVKQLAVIFLPLALALILSALLVPAVDWLDRRGLPRGSAVLLVLLAGLAAVGGILAFVVDRLIEGLPELFDKVTESVESLRSWLTQGPLDLNREQINNLVDSAIQALREQQSRLTSGAISTASTITEIVAGVFITAFALVYFLHGGRRIYQFVTQVFPTSVREKVRRAGKAGFGGLIGYVRGAFVVAFIDAVGIGAGLLIMGVPLALPVASFVFLGAFIPFVGAVVTGLLAVLVAFLAKGWIFALITLGLVLAVQQLEGNVVQPLVMGRAVAIHPLAVLIGLTTGALVAGIAGALLAVPVLAFCDHTARVLLERDDDAGDGSRGDGHEPGRSG